GLAGSPVARTITTIDTTTVAGWFPTSRDPQGFHRTDVDSLLGSGFLALGNGFVPADGTVAVLIQREQLRVDDVALTVCLTEVTVNAHSHALFTSAFLTDVVVDDQASANRRQMTMPNAAPCDLMTAM